MVRLVTTRQLDHVPPRSAERASHTPIVSVHKAYSRPAPSQASGSTQRGVTPPESNGAQSRCPGAECSCQVVPPSVLTAMRSTPGSNLLPEADSGTMRTATSPCGPTARWLEPP